MTSELATFTRTSKLSQKWESPHCEVCVTIGKVTGEYQHGVTPIKSIQIIQKYYEYITTIEV